ncbi:MAG TPA: DUF1223 domain-containing protein [Solibacterales bacterium]|nr:DUF1223 domain-containing protein [Bryobacterales bacterium]
MITRRALLAGLAHSVAASNVRTPVLVELFTSQGCSSCPPADRLLERLDREQPVAGADVLVLSEHVDYWNYLGWTDPFSSPAFSARQQRYVERFRLESAYTPQMVVDGASQFVGSDARRAEAAIAEAAGRPKKALRLELRGPALSFFVEQPAAGEAVIVALARETASVGVGRGENAGRQLRHVAVAEKLIETGRSQGEVNLRRERFDGYRIVAFAQDRTGRITAAARATMSRDVQEHSAAL